MNTRLFARSVAGAVAAGGLALALAPAAAAETAPGPAFVDQLGSQLRPLRDAGPGDIADARDAGLTIERGEVLVGVVVSGDLEAAAARLEDLGMRVVATAEEPRPTVEGGLPVDSIEAVAKSDLSEAIIPVMAFGTDEADVGAQTSEGVVRHNLPAAISAAGTSGAGVQVGVISDSIDEVGTGVAGSQATGDLPASVTVLLDEPGGSDEGRAMAEIIFDEAPGLQRILFSSGTLGAVSKAASIDNLVANGADLIADDIFYLGEPFFQDGVIAQAVDRAKAAGVPYLASAGNRARQSYQSTYRPDGGGGLDLHDFDPGPGVVTRNCFSQPIPNNPNARITVALGWDEPVGGVTTDLDLRITNPAGTTTFAVSNASSNLNGDPKEIATFPNNTGSAQTPCVEIRRFTGSRAPFLKWIEQDNYTQGVPQFDTQSDTINPDAASARGSLAVAAVAQDDPGLNTPEPFSSRGPKTRFFDAAGNRLTTPLVLAKPALAAADKVMTTVPGFNPFFGTSAATPSAAGIVTILRSTNPNATVNEIYAQLTNPANAIPCATGNPIQDCGAGFILADRAVAGLDRTAVSPTALLSPRTPNGKRGWFTKRTVMVFWNTSDPESPTESTSGCETTTVRAQGVTVLTCNAVSGGGPGTGRVTIKHDSKKPRKPKVKGIKAGKTYEASRLPAKKKVKKCKSRDATSGLKSCKVKGYSAKPGKHKLKATATDKAGLKAKRTVKYRVR